MLLWLVLWFAALALCALLAVANSYRGSTGGYGVPFLFLVPGLAVLLAGAIFPFFWAARDNRRIAEQRDQARLAIDEFLKRTDRQRHGQQGSWDDTTTRQRQHAWYRDHNELVWRDRVQGEMLGFDNADDYTNNWSESEH